MPHAVTPPPSRYARLKARLRGRGRASTPSSLPPPRVRTLIPAPGAPTGVGTVKRALGSVWKLARQNPKVVVGPPFVLAALWVGAQFVAEPPVPTELVASEVTLAFGAVDTEVVSFDGALGQSIDALPRRGLLEPSPDLALNLRYSTNCKKRTLQLTAGPCGEAGGVAKTCLRLRATDGDEKNCQLALTSLQAAGSPWTTDGRSTLALDEDGESIVLKVGNTPTTVRLFSERDVIGVAGLLAENAAAADSGSLFYQAAEGTAFDLEASSPMRTEVVLRVWPDTAKQPPRFEFRFDLRTSGDPSKLTLGSEPRKRTDALEEWHGRRFDQMTLGVWPWLEGVVQ